MTDFAGVLKSWDHADPTRIHPTREHESESAYWASGVTQAAHIARHIPDGGMVVDFGCGDGRLTYPLARMGFDVIAVDASKAMLTRLRDGCGETEFRSLQSDGLNLGDKVKGADVVIARAVLIHHSHADVERLVHALTAAIKPGGLFIADWPTGVHHERIDWIDVTTWRTEHRLQVATDAGLVLVEDSKPSIWRKQ